MYNILFNPHNPVTKAGQVFMFYKKESKAQERSVNLPEGHTETIESNKDADSSSPTIPQCSKSLS